jgi:hypothetical protein
MNSDVLSAVLGAQKNAYQLCWLLRGANMQSTSAQKFAQIFVAATPNYYPTVIVARQRTGAASVTCAGGISDGTNQIVAAAQSWVTLASGVIVTASLAALCTTTLLSVAPSLTLTTGSTAACTADLYIYGWNIS